MMVNAELIQGIINNAVLLPQSAIIRTAKSESTVYVVDANSKVQVRPVTVQGTYQGQWIVTSGTPNKASKWLWWVLPKLNLTKLLK